MYLAIIFQNFHIVHEDAVSMAYMDIQCHVILCALLSMLYVSTAPY